MCIKTSVSFWFQEFKDFDLEQHQECAYDHVEIYDGEDRNGHSLGKFCGSRIPESIIAGSGNMFISFYSDASVSRKGFRAEHSTSKYLLILATILILFCIFPGGGHSHVKVTGVRLLTHQIKGLSVIIFLQKGGSLGDRSKKRGPWVWNCTKSRQFNIFILKFLLRFTKVFNSEHWVLSCEKGGHSVTNPMQKRGSIDRCMMYTGPWDTPYLILGIFYRLSSISNW